MIQGFDLSYQYLEPFYGRKLISPDSARQKPNLAKSIGMIEALCATFFAGRFPNIEGVWGIENVEEPNGAVSLRQGTAEIFLTVGALELFHNTNQILASNRWISREVYPRLFDGVTPPAIPDNDLGNTVQLFGLAMLFCHEIGHVYDMHFVAAATTEEIDLQRAEEISADGHAILAGLQLIDVWAMDKAAELQYDVVPLRKLGAFLLILANALLDEIDVDQSWKPEPGIPYPRGVMRLVGACAHVNDHFECDAEHFGVEVLELVLDTLLPPSAHDSLDSESTLTMLFKGYDSALIRLLYDELEQKRAQRLGTASTSIG